MNSSFTLSKINQRLSDFNNGKGNQVAVLRNSNISFASALDVKNWTGTIIFIDVDFEMMKLHLSDLHQFLTSNQLKKQITLEEYEYINIPLICRQVEKLLNLPHNAFTRITQGTKRMDSETCKFLLLNFERTILSENLNDLSVQLNQLCWLGIFCKLFQKTMECFYFFQIVLLVCLKDCLIKVAIKK